MNLTLPRMLRPKMRTMIEAVSVPSPPLPPKALDERLIELRTAFREVDKSYFELGEVVKDEAVVNCRIFANRYRAVESLPKGGVVAEVGTQTGRFADFIFRTSTPIKLHLFDLSLEWFDTNVLGESIRRGQVEIHLGDSAAELGKFPAEHFDWLYIDGDHSYAGVKKDIAQAIRTVKRDGVLVFNDYTVWSPLEACNYGVLKAINELVNSGEWEFLYLALHPWGYHDVALRRRCV